MFQMIEEESEAQNCQIGDNVDASGVQISRQENFTFPRRKHFSKALPKKVNWAELLAKATEEDKKTCNDISDASDDSEEESENVENLIPDKNQDNIVLDLSAVKKKDPRCIRRNYTMPVYQPQLPPNNINPLKEINSLRKLPNTSKIGGVKENLEVAAKKSLFCNDQVLYEREVISHERVSMQPYMESISEHEINNHYDYGYRTASEQFATNPSLQQAIHYRQPQTQLNVQYNHHSNDDKL